MEDSVTSICDGHLASGKEAPQGKTMQDGTPTDRLSKTASSGTDHSVMSKTARMSRRRFAVAGTATPIVLGSLISKPVLAAAPYQCTISGQMSGNTSSHGGVVNCSTLGRSPEYWKSQSSWPAGLIAGAMPGDNCNFSSSSQQGTVFNGFSVAGTAALTTAFMCKTNASACKVYDLGQGFPGGCSAATMLQVLMTGGTLDDTPSKRLGRAAIASILNAVLYGMNYPLTAKQVIDMYNAVCRGGVYQVNSTTSWSASQVQSYFESLYS